MRGWCQRFGEEKAEYCKAWGISFYCYEDTLDPSREPTWSKVVALQRHLGDHDWLFWIDADAAITNESFDVRKLCIEDADVVITHDHAGFNAGIFLLRNLPVVHEFLERVWDRNISRHHFEQTAMMQIMDEMPHLRVKTIPKRSMNSYWFDHRPGDFVFHAAGEPTEMKSKLLAAFSNAAREYGSRDPEIQVSDDKNRRSNFTVEPERSERRAVISTCVISHDLRYLSLCALWAEGVRRSGWDEDVVIFSNRPNALLASSFVRLYDIKIMPIRNPSSSQDTYRQKAVSALLALQSHSEILFTDIDVVLKRNPAEWAFSHDRMMVSQDVFSLFHPCMLRAWYPDEADEGQAGANSGIWSLSSSHVKHSLEPWYHEMTWRLDSGRWPVKPTLNDQPQLNKLWYERRIEMGLFPKDKISYPSTPKWPGNNPEAWAVHCCGVPSSEAEMRKALA